MNSKYLLSVTLCPTNICQNGGTCYVVLGTSVCTCPPNWTGTTCNIAIAATTQGPGMFIGVDD